jgi:ABC-type phosphate/phosphonate transport system permease subunit
MCCANLVNVFLTSVIIGIAVLIPLSFLSTRSLAHRIVYNVGLFTLHLLLFPCFLVAHFADLRGHRG